MTYRATILNVSASIYLFGILIYTIFNITTLTASEGWGIVSMFGLAAIGLLTLLADFILQRFIKSYRTLNIVGLIILLGLAISIISEI